VAAPAAPAQPKALPANLTDEERSLLAGLTVDGKVHIDALIQALGWESHVVSRRLLVLEMQGLVRQWPGMYYSLT
jgi:DNA processing protein